ncbi:MAG: HD domain-containing protein [Candidatus Omnitrophica bacterium]|nr:HD domain-containing protein [Candidatus Omnitrophota bacterium]
MDKNNKDQVVIKEVLTLARSCHYEQEHSHQVTRLALKLYDELKTLHGLKKNDRLLLQSASLLHDIGWIKGRKRHHKTSRDIIIKSSKLSFNNDERLVVALIARYHRRSLPKNSHKYYSNLGLDKKEKLKKMAGMLRMADGLDRSHLSSVKNLTCTQKGKEIVIHIESDDFKVQDKETALQKSDLFRDVFQKNIKIVWNKNKKQE